jgi:two-component system cell cycle sensor histidine kinase/response regulator CckA
MPLTSRGQTRSPVYTGLSGELQFMEPKEAVILLAEDDLVIRNLVTLMLSKEGYSVLTANDGQEAFEICRRFKNPIHLLLTDKTMPRMSNLELAESVLEKRPEIKIMTMSGETANMILNKNTPNAFLPKPFMPPTLLTCMRRLLTAGFKGICQESDLL